MRQLVILTRPITDLPPNIPYLAVDKLPDRPFSIAFANAKTLLGQEFPCAVYDMQAPQGICLHLEALAIIAGTIQRSGTLYLHCPSWLHLEQCPDLDSLRWHSGEAIATPYFYRYFKQLVAEFDFQLETSGRISADICNNPPPASHRLTAEQQAIFSDLPTDTASIHIITAPRGRGKSTLLGKLAKTFTPQHSLLMSARSRAFLPSVWRAIEAEHIPFFAPDVLIQQIELNQISPHQWLFVDEAASLPLPQLQRFCHFFDKVILASTTHNYEGTGRGFPQKLLPQLCRPVRHWQLSQPLRWKPNDPLEAFINRLLLLTPAETSGRFPAEICKKLVLYQLLAEAHYKTTATDLRRLFDAPDQQYYTIYAQQNLVAAAWAMTEGNLDEALMQAIWRGERRPQGNLVAQYLCFQGNLTEACRLRSIRLSRLAVQPSQQRQGYGKQLVLQILSHIDPLVDFVSVSFGLNDGLLTFWQQCGFRLVYITPNREASSGYHSAMMLFPLSEQGKQFVQQAQTQFERDFPLLPLPSDLQNYVPIRPLAQSLTPADWQNLRGFAFAQRTFSACYPAFVRLVQHFPALHSHFSRYLDRRPSQLNKTEQAALRQTLRDVLISMNVKKI